MNRRLFALFLLLFVTLAVVAAPMNVGENVLETRTKKAVAKAKPVEKSKPVVKPVAKPKLVPKPASKLKPVSKPAAKPVPKKASAKAKSAGKPKPVVKPVPKPLAKPVAKKPVAKPATGSNQPAPPTSCPVPGRKPAVRRFLEFIGFSRGLSAPDCTTGSTSTSATAAPLSKAGQRKANKAAAKAQKAAADKAAADANKPPVDGKAESEEPVVQDEPEPVVKPEAETKPAKPVKKPEPKPAQPVAAPSSVLPLAFGKRPVGTVENAPTQGVSCLDRSNEQEKISLADIEIAVKLAQAGPLQKPLKPGQQVKFFPHVFSNFDNQVNLPGVCNGKKLEEHAVGRNMAKFHNNDEDIKKFNQFRVVITQPDATGKTTFCGVMTHGTQEMGNFEKDLCTELT
ncbi:hypothetical protein B0H13DRAFT_2307523 [Mycena leptocephala]|nr:hypothetical protein B0H13DRAFT_2307523 [Mycena leptocephala]